MSEFERRMIAVTATYDRNLARLCDELLALLPAGDEEGGRAAVREVLREATAANGPHGEFIALALTVGLGAAALAIRDRWAQEQ